MKGYKWLVIAIIVVALLSTAFLLIKPGGMPSPMARGERVVVIYLSGAIAESGGGTLGLSQDITPRLVEQQLEKAANDRSIKAVVLRVNSPGGSVAASQQIASYVRKFPKPLVVSMGDTAASGGYYISVPAQGIVAQPGTLTGSIGVISQVLDMEGLYEKLGIKVETIKSGRHKDMLSREMTPEERELMQALSNELYEQFISDVAAGRNLDQEKVRELATGQVYTGTQALELGLIDRLGGIDEAVEWAGELAGVEEPVKYEFAPPSLWEQISGSVVEIVGLVDKMNTPPEVQLLNYLQQHINRVPRLILE